MAESQISETSKHQFSSTFHFALALARRYRDVNRRLNAWYPRLEAGWRARSRLERVRSVMEQVRQEIDHGPDPCANAGELAPQPPVLVVAAGRGDQRCDRARRLVTIRVLVCGRCPLPSHGESCSIRLRSRCRGAERADQGTGLLRAEDESTPRLPHVPSDPRPSAAPRDLGRGR